MGKLEKSQVFIRIVESGSISKAADQLHMTKSAVSKSLSELEKDLGVKLLDRTTRTQHLTDSGQHFYKQALDIVSDFDSLFSDTITKANEVKGDLRISLPLSFGTQHLMQPIDEFIRLYPLVKLDITYSDSQLGIVDEGFDLVVRIGELKDSTLRAKKLTMTNMSILASPRFILENQTIQSHYDLANLPFLKYSGDSSNKFNAVDTDGNSYSTHLKTRLIANNGEVLMQLAENGQGFTILPDFISYRSIEEGKLIRLLDDLILSPLAAWVLYPNTKSLPKRTRVFMDHLTNHFSGKADWQPVTT